MPVWMPRTHLGRDCVKGCRVKVAPMKSAGCNRPLTLELMSTKKHDMSVDQKMSFTVFDRAFDIKKLPK